MDGQTHKFATHAGDVHTHADKHIYFDEHMELNTCRWLTYATVQMNMNTH